jgi:glycosyltransferase involved in cell wall biosynthesis
MNETPTRLSVVCPAYEEESALPYFHAELMRVLDGLGDEYELEVIYVDDGSRDDTLGSLRRIAADDPRVRYLSLSRNFGHQAALTAGLEHATGDLTITMDSDLQHPPEVIPQLLEEWKRGADVVITVRADDPTLAWSKRFGSKMFYRMMRWVSGTEVRPSAADFRLMTRPAVAALLRMKESHRFVRGMVQWLGFPCREVHFAPRQRVAGKSKYTLRKQLTLGFDGMFSFSKLPLRASLYLGAFLALLGVGCSLWLLIGVIAGFLANPMLWILLAAMNLIGGATLLGVGVVGEYVGRIYEQVKGRPAYFLKETGNLEARTCEAVPQRVAARPRKPLAA